GHVPVDGADVVAGLVLADLLEGDAGALEDAVVLAAEQVLDGAAGPELKAADLADDFAGEHAVPTPLRRRCFEACQGARCRSPRRTCRRTAATRKARRNRLNPCRPRSDRRRCSPGVR